MPFFLWLESLPLSQAILTGTWYHPLLLIGHSIGMGAVVGIIFMLDMRVLGYAKGVPLHVFARLVPVGWAGFVLNFVTGVLMFMAYANTMATNWTFQLKMICIVAGGVCLWLLARALRRSIPGGAGDVVSFDGRAKMLAIVTMVFWLGAIATGRLIAYTAPEGT